MAKIGGEIFFISSSRVFLSLKTIGGLNEIDDAEG